LLPGCNRALVMWAVMSSEQTKEEIMKKLALTIIAVLGLSMIVVAQAPARSTGIPPAVSQALKLRQEYAPGMTRAEYRALMLRSEGLNQKYGVVQVKGENFYARGFATTSEDSVPVKGENYFANGLPTSAPAVGSPTTNFEWRNVEIGVASLLGLVAIIVGLVGLRRHRLHLRTS
jgi:hypothetical protein